MNCGEKMGDERYISEYCDGEATLDCVTSYILFSYEEKRLIK